ncbi:HNH endonuclease [Rubellimicrobium rubrum]|uniref:HNH endonuclease n=1 Tax=Rubellimicrobium rubrum TaxID=2585369 RepID=A0A5C4MPG3_9RHOB|nr:HNH endonuclease [Rubellimicrobium rubrum]TNC46257.1 HNH endonuclease [Rubellimicrobium rubrum]
MLRIFVGVTHKPWFDFLAGIAPDEVNFWQPSGSGEFRALRPGDLFLFKLKAPWNAIAGGGVFAHASLAPLSLAWEAFGQKNGNPDAGSMRRTIAQLRRAAPLSEREDPVIGCRILTQPFFWPEELWLPEPASFAANTVAGKGYSTDNADGLALWEAVRERLALTTNLEAEGPAFPVGPGLRDPAAPFVPDPTGPRYGAPASLQRRLGQGAFRLAVTDGYGRRCAVSGERTLPILDAAHVRPYAEGGGHEVSNGLLLRTDIHRLFDLGYVTVTEKGHFAVSARLKSDFDNGVHYYAMQGKDLRAPERGFAPPAPEALRWHRENRYLG